MGTYFTAVVNHNLNAHDIHTLPDLLNSSWHTIEHVLPIIEGYPALSKWQWREEEGGFSLEKLHEHVTTIMEGHEFRGIVSERVFRVWHGVRWWTFLSEQTIRDSVRRVCRHIASVLNSGQVIYLPSGFLKPEGALGLMYEGKAVEEMIAWLLENCGPPVQNIESIYRGELESWNANGYYIERV